MVDANCKYCNKSMKVRQADLNRGWGKFCSKSCKAKEQIKRIPYPNPEYKSNNDNYSDPYYDLENMGHIHESGYFGHGQN